MTEKSILEEGMEAARLIRPTRDRVLVELRRDLQKVGMVWLPDGGQSLDVVCSRVVALGPEVKARPWELAPGDYVLHVRVVGVAYDGVLGLIGRQADKKTASHKILKESEILAVVSPDAVGRIDGKANYDEGRTGQRDTRDL